MMFLYIYSPLVKFPFVLLTGLNCTLMRTASCNMVLVFLPNSSSHEGSESLQGIYMGKLKLLIQKIENLEMKNGIVTLHLRKIEGCFMPCLLGRECTPLADVNTSNNEKNSVKKVITLVRGH